MELNISGAAHCSVEHCHQLDFLPFKCDACGKTYCQDHFAHAHHDCPHADRSSAQVVLCPICQQSIRMQQGEDPNVTWERHFTQACSQVPQAAKKGPKRCPVPGCKEQLGLSNKFECQRCGQTVCMRHRMQEDHPCQVARPKAGAATSSGRPAAAPTSAGRSRSLLTAGRAAAAQPIGARPAAGRARSSDARGQAQMSEDERLARELQEQEDLWAQAGGDLAAPANSSAAAAPPGASPAVPKKKKNMSERVASMFACLPRPGFKPSQQGRSRLLDERDR